MKITFLHTTKEKHSYGRCISTVTLGLLSNNTFVPVDAWNRYVSDLLSPNMLESHIEYEGFLDKVFKDYKDHDLIIMWDEEVVAEFNYLSDTRGLPRVQEIGGIEKKFKTFNSVYPVSTLEQSLADNEVQISANLNTSLVYATHQAKLFMHLYNSNKWPYDYLKTL